MPRVTVTTDATAILAANTGDPDQYNVRNRGSVAVYLDNAATVTTSTGYQLDPGEAVSIPLQKTNGIWGIVASGTCRVDVLGVWG